MDVYTDAQITLGRSQCLGSASVCRALLQASWLATRAYAAACVSVARSSSASSALPSRLAGSSSAFRLSHARFAVNMPTHSASSLSRFAASSSGPKVTASSLPMRRQFVLFVDGQKVVAFSTHRPNPSVERTPSSWPPTTVVHLASSGQLEGAAHLKR